MTVTAEGIKAKLIAKGYSTSPGLLAETIFAYVLDERERCAKIVEAAECYEHQTAGCTQCLLGIASAIRKG